MSRAVLSIGANVGDRAGYLRVAVSHFGPWLVAVSPVYRTPPWGPVPQDDYLNAVLIADDPDATPTDWLARSQAAEAAGGRTRGVRWGARTLDVDVIDVDGMSLDTAELVLPHPRAAERAFVLVPWLAVDAGATLPGTGPVAGLLAGLAPDDVAAVQPTGEVLDPTGDALSPSGDVARPIGDVPR